jgi:diguanylate cyclase (GGDEF)-like protein/PAS domain S-box-containing protein
MNREVPAKNFSLASILWAIIIASLLIHILSMVVGHTVLSDWHWTGVAVHTALEMSGAITALFVAIFLLRYERFGRGTHFNIRIAAALISMGVLDGFHAIVTPGNTFVWLHSIATFYGGLLFSFIFLPAKWLTFNASYWPRIALISAMAIGMTSFIYPEFIPLMIQNGEFTLIAILLNAIGGILLFASAIQLLLTYQKHKNTDDLLFGLHCSLFGAAAITFQQSSLWDTPWWGWHILRFLAYAVALWFVIRGEGKILSELEEHRHHLTELVAQQTEKVKRSEAQLTVAQRVAHLGSWRLDIKLGESQWSDELYRIFGFAPLAVPATITTLSRILHQDDKERFLTSYNCNQVQGDPMDCECRIIRPNGEMRYVHLSGLVNRDEKGRPCEIVGTALDITDQKQREAHIEHLANHDDLTNLPSLRLARERINTELARANRNNTMFAVMFIDLDGFKEVNDSLGHEVGDGLLRKVAKRLSNCLRNVDTVARIGGDEFLVLQTEVKNADNVAYVAKKLIKAIATTTTISGHKIKVSASVGISMYPDDGDNLNLLMRTADQAMYLVKKSGKNHFKFASDFQLAESLKAFKSS